MSKKKPKPGRPFKKPSERLSEQMMVRMTSAERRKLETEAKRQGISLSALILQPWRTVWSDETGKE